MAPIKENIVKNQMSNKKIIIIKKKKSIHKTVCIKFSIQQTSHYLLNLCYILLFCI